MPTYEYKCDACGHAFEQFHSMTASPIRKCPACKKLKVKRLIGTGAGLIFKGSGFYITDYRDQGYKDKAKADSGDGASKPDAGSTGGESGGNGAAAGDPKKGEAKPAAAGAPAEGKSAGAATAAAAAPAKSDSKPPAPAGRGSGKKGK